MQAPTHSAHVTLALMRAPSSPSAHVTLMRAPSAPSANVTLAPSGTLRAPGAPDRSALQLLRDLHVSGGGISGGSERVNSIFYLKIIILLNHVVLVEVENPLVGPSASGRYERGGSLRAATILSPWDSSAGGDDVALGVHHRSELGK